MDNTHNHPPRTLTPEEARILRLVQEIYGNHNTPDNCFMTNDGEMAIFVRNSRGESPIMVNLTFVADVSREQELTEEAIKNKWLRS